MVHDAGGRGADGERSAPNLITVMRLSSFDIDDPSMKIDAIDDAVFDVQAVGIATLKVSEQFFTLKRI